MLEEFHWLDALDICVVSMGLYFLLSWIRKAGSHLLGAGLVAVAALYLFALTADLRLTAYLFQIFFTVFSVILVILFQKEIRHALERFALLLFKAPFARQRVLTAQEEMLDTLVSTIMDLAQQRVGALIVFQGSIDLERHTHGGSLLNGRVSEPILKSIFDPHSMGHDGALIVIGETLDRFGCHLRLSQREVPGLKRRGTRHAAALGITEDTDALCVVVSEEQGSVSIAQSQHLSSVQDAPDLHAALTRFYGTYYSGRMSFPRLALGSFHPGRMVMALLTAFLLWFFCIHDAAIEYSSFTVPVRYTGLDPQFKVRTIEPEEVRVVVSAPRRYFYFNRASDFFLTVRLYDAEQLGVHEQTLVASDVNLPSHMQFENIWPRVVKFQLESSASR